MKIEDVKVGMKVEMIYDAFGFKKGEEFTVIGVHRDLNGKPIVRVSDKCSLCPRLLKPVRQTPYEYLLDYYGIEEGDVFGITYRDHKFGEGCSFLNEKLYDNSTPVFLPHPLTNLLTGNVQNLIVTARKVDIENEKVRTEIDKLEKSLLDTKSKIRELKSKLQ